MNRNVEIYINENELLTINYNDKTLKINSISSEGESFDINDLTKMQKDFINSEIKYILELEKTLDN